MAAQIDTTLEQHGGAEQRNAEHTEVNHGEKSSHIATAG
jgi:hypothetical protein